MPGCDSKHTRAVNEQSGAHEDDIKHGLTQFSHQGNPEGAALSDCGLASHFVTFHVFGRNQATSPSALSGARPLSQQNDAGAEIHEKRIEKSWRSLQ